MGKNLGEFFLILYIGMCNMLVVCILENLNVLDVLREKVSGKNGGPTVTNWVFHFFFFGWGV